MKLHPLLQFPPKRKLQQRTRNFFLNLKGCSTLIFFHKFPQLLSNMFSYTFVLKLRLTSGTCTIWLTDKLYNGVPHQDRVLSFGHRRTLSSLTILYSELTHSLPNNTFESSLFHSTTLSVKSFRETVVTSFVHDPYLLPSLGSNPNDSQS